MNTRFERNAGYALMLFTLLMVFTMVLHPAGGDFEYLLKIKERIIVTHSVALLSIPFAAVGFWGLTKRLGIENFFSISAFAMIVFGLVAVMAAATTNGLVLPIFIQNYDGSFEEHKDVIKPLLKYNFAINKAYDYIYTVAFCLAIIFWSIAILYSKKLKPWLAYAGILLAVLAIMIFFSGIISARLQGFRVFVSSILLWILFAGVALIRVKDEEYLLPKKD